MRRLHLAQSLSGYADFYPQYPVVMPIIKAITGMAVEKGLMASPEAIARANAVKERGDTAMVAGEPTEACFIVDLRAGLTDRENAHLDTVVRKFEEIAMFDEFTQVLEDD